MFKSSYLCLSILFINIITIFSSSSNCQFSNKFTCDSFKSKDDGEKNIDLYLSNIMKYEGNFAKPGIGYDEKSGYTYDGHSLNYTTGELYGEPHLFSAPSKESIHISILTLAINGNKYAQTFIGSFDKAIEILTLKIKGYSQFNATYPGFGCFTPWVGFNLEDGTINPIDSWSPPQDLFYKVPGLDNGEWFWSLYAVTHTLENLGDKYIDLANAYREFVNCQKKSAKDIFYRGDGQVSATVYILDVNSMPISTNYIQEGDNLLNDPYEGETMTQLLYLFSEWENEIEREILWIKKRDLFQKINYEIPNQYIKGDNNLITIQKGYWFSTHEQWKTLLLPYLSDDLPLVKKIFKNCEKVRTWDAYINKLPGMLASVNDVTDGSEIIPDYASACGIEKIGFESIERRDILTPYSTFGVFLHDQVSGLCWYNNILQGPRMQSLYGSTEAINANGTEISPITTWDSKITTVLSILGGIGEITMMGLKNEIDPLFGNSYKRFVHIVNKEHVRVFGDINDVLGDEYGFMYPSASVPKNMLTDWKIDC